MESLISENYPAFTGTQGRLQLAGGSPWVVNVHCTKVNNVKASFSFTTYENINLSKIYFRYTFIPQIQTTFFPITQNRHKATFAKHDDFVYTCRR